MREITLHRIDEHLARALEGGTAAFESYCGARLGSSEAVVRHVVAQTLEMLRAAPREAAWGGYLAVDPERAIMVGTCGFKSAPNPEGRVEVAYFTFPGFEGRGYATAMAAKLIESALASPQVMEVIAHTLPEKNASTRVLEKVGMSWAGEVQDPEDGRVWRWQFPPGI